jgi:HEAT repeat protein
MMNYFKDAPLPHAWLIAAVLPFFGKDVYEYIVSLLKPDALPTSKLLLLINVTAQFKLPESLAQLRTLYAECTDLDIRLNALRAIGKINDLFAVKTAIDALTAEEWQIRSVACIIIGEMSIKGAAYRLIPLLKDKYWYVRKNAAGALVKLGKLGLNALIAYLEIDDKNAREMIVQTLEENGIVEQAILNLQSGDEAIKNESLNLIKAVSEKGFNQYLENYRSTMPIIDKLIG